MKTKKNCGKLAKGHIFSFENDMDALGILLIFCSQTNTHIMKNI